LTASGGHHVPPNAAPLGTGSRTHSLDHVPSAAEFSDQGLRAEPRSPAFQLGPKLRPLDLAKLTHSDSVFQELGQTASDMSQWLNLVVNGLDDLLTGGGENETEMV
jgi:hypothetical protein